MSPKEEWTVAYREWSTWGEALSANEEAGIVPDSDEYNDYDDEAARLVLAAAFLLGVTA